MKCCWPSTVFMPGYLSFRRAAIKKLDFALTAEDMSRLRALDKAIPMIGNPEKPELVEMAMKW